MIYLDSTSFVLPSAANDGLKKRRFRTSVTFLAKCPASGRRACKAPQACSDPRRDRPGAARRTVEKPFMNRILARAAFAAAFSIMLTAQARAINITPDAPDIQIPVRLTERLSSQDAQNGQRFGVETTREVKIGEIDVPLGTKGHGVVESAQSARGQRAGKLVLSMRSLDLADGRTIPVNFSLEDPPKSEDAKGAPISLGKGVVTVGGYASYGTNVVYEKGTAFTVAPLAASDFKPALGPK
jgi:hypothetical protein